jgi:hypothetical protein
MRLAIGAARAFICEDQAVAKCQRQWRPLALVWCAAETEALLIKAHERARIMALTHYCSGVKTIAEEIKQRIEWTLYCLRGNGLRPHNDNRIAAMFALEKAWELAGAALKFATAEPEPTHAGTETVN